MARIPRRFIDQLVGQSDISNVIGRAVALKRSGGSNMTGLCPFHQEKTPSFQVNTAKGVYYCFGCGAGGNVITFLMEHDQLSFVEAVEELARLNGVAVPYQGREDDDTDSHRRGLALLADIASWYQQTLAAASADGKLAREYLRRRGMSGAVLTRFGIGLAPDGWDGLVGRYRSRQADLLAVGLAKKNDSGRVYDCLRRRIVIPIRDPRGRVIAFGGRLFVDDSDGPKYLNTPETAFFQKRRTLYGVYEMKNADNKRPDSIIVVEGYMDVIALHAASVTNVVATLGTSVTVDHIRALQTLSRHIVFCFDGDAAGQRAAMRAMEQALTVLHGDVTAAFLFLPDNHDPDSYIRAHGADAMRAAVAGAIPLAQCFLNMLSADTSFHTIEAREQWLHTVVPLYRTIADETHRRVIAETIAQAFGRSAAQITAVLSADDDHRKTQRAVVKSRVVKTPMVSAQLVVLLHPTIVATVCNEAALIPVYGDADQARDVALRMRDSVSADVVVLWHIDGAELLAELIECVEHQPTITTAGILEALRDHPQAPHLHALLADKALADEYAIIDDALVREFARLIDHLRTTHTRAYIRALLRKSQQGAISTAEQTELRTLLSSRDILQM